MCSFYSTEQLELINVNEMEQIDFMVGFFFLSCVCVAKAQKETIYSDN